MQLHFVIRTMRIMTLSTVLFHWRMHLLQVKGIAPICMALKTYLTFCRLGDEKLCVV